MSSVLELCHRYIIPALKRALTEVMHEELKLSRVEVARKLGISPSAVSRYLHRERGAMVEVSGKPELMSELRRLATEIVRGDMSQYEIEVELLRIAFRALSGKHFCGYHQRLEPEIDPAACSICPELFSAF